MASPLEMYSKICPTKLDLVGYILKWVGKGPVIGYHYFELCVCSIAVFKPSALLDLHLLSLIDASMYAYMHTGYTNLSWRT